MEISLPDKNSPSKKTIKSIKSEYIVYQDLDVTLLDGVKLLELGWMSADSSSPSPKIFSSFKIPNHWFNLHHPYIKTTTKAKRFKINCIDDQSSKFEETLEANPKSGELELELIKEEFDKLFKSKTLPLFSLLSTQYLDVEPHRPKVLLWEDKVSFPDYMNMMKSMLSFSVLQVPSIISEVEKIPILSSGSSELTLDQLFFKHICNENYAPVLFKLLPTSDEYWLPPNSGFLISDLSQASEFLPPLSPKHGFDLIVMDPPYLNVSAQRSNAYNMEDLYTLFQLPVPKLLNPSNGIVAVWITNRPKVRRFIINKLFKSWGISLVAEWAWVKITTSGEPVLDFDSKHKKPYELILFGSKATSAIPHQHVLVSVPCKIHSRKPPIFDLIAPFLQKKREDCSFLELFGRSLYPNTLTWGNEPIKFQAVEPYC